jgi:hypothetical protein
MIVKSFASKRTKPIISYLPQPANPAWYTAAEYAQAKARNISVEEYVRRDKIVQKLATECPYQTGDTAYPSFKKDYMLYGAVLIVGVTRSYKDFSHDHDWPKNDNPMIVTFAPLNDRKQHIFCTTNYLVKKNPYLVTC